MNGLLLTNLLQLNHQSSSISTNGEIHTMRALDSNINNLNNTGSGDFYNLVFSQLPATPNTEYNKILEDTPTSQFKLKKNQTFLTTTTTALNNKEIDPPILLQGSELLDTTSLATQPESNKIEKQDSLPTDYQLPFKHKRLSTENAIRGHALLPHDLNSQKVLSNGSQSLEQISTDTAECKEYLNQYACSYGMTILSNNPNNNIGEAAMNEAFSSHAGSYLQHHAYTTPNRKELMRQLPNTIGERKTNDAPDFHQITTTPATKHTNDSNHSQIPTLTFPGQSHTTTSFNLANGELSISKKSTHNAIESLQENVAVSQTERNTNFTQNKNIEYTTTLSEFTKHHDSPLEDKEDSPPVDSSSNVKQEPRNQTDALRQSTSLSDKFEIHHKITDQVTAAVSSAYHKNNKTITFQLNPMELGKIDVSIDIGSQGKTNIIIVAERPDTLDLLLRDAKVLEKSLHDLGITKQNSNLQFDLSGHQHRHQSHQQQFVDTNEVGTHPTLQDDKLPSYQIQEVRPSHTQAIDLIA